MKLPTGTVGAISELRVCAFLLSRGYEVFRSVSPSCSCDLAILKDGKLLRIEVRSGYRQENGRIITSRKHIADVLAIAIKDEVIFEPELF